MIFNILLVVFAAVHADIMHEVRQPQPYSFGYTVKDHEGVQHRQESGNGAGVVHGNYGFVDNKGIRREVNYVADHGGFRAQVKTNEPGTAGQSPASVDMISMDSYAHGAALPYVSKINYPVVPAPRESDAVYGFPTSYDHPAYSHENIEPSQGYKFITPYRENRYHMSDNMPSYPINHQMPVEVPVHHRDLHHMPAHIPVQDHVAPHRSPVHVPAHPRDHYMPVHVPVHPRDRHMPAVDDYVAPHRASAHMPVHYEDSYLNSYEHGYDNKYEPSYMGGLAHGNLLGAGYRGHGGVVNYNTKLVGGVIRGHDSRFTKQ